MVIIFSASADNQSYRHSSIYFEPLLHWLFPKMPAAQVELLHHLFRKTCHMLEYAILAALCWRAIRRSTTNTLKNWRWDEAGLALALVFAYAASDELHQTFVPTRTGQIPDVMVDVVGGAAGLALLWLRQKLFRPAEK